MSVVPLDKFFRGRGTASNMLDECIKKYDRSLTAMICPRCLSENVAFKGFVERLNEEVRRCHCRNCWHWFTEDWKPIRLQAILQERMNLALTLVCRGMGMKEMAELMLTVQRHEEVEEQPCLGLSIKSQGFSRHLSRYICSCAGAFQRKL